MRALARYAGFLPFGAYVALGLIIPLAAVAIGAFQDPGTGAFTFANVSLAVHGSYLAGFRESLLLSVMASVIPGVSGMAIAYAIFTARRATLLRQVVITASGVFANFGGVPLAFLFVTVLGSSGLATRWLSDLGFSIYGAGFSLYSLTGIVVVYMYFQIPLMVLVMLPALEGLRPAWREAAENLGARRRQYWLHVGGPVLAPSFLASVLLLFGFALSAYATADALTSGTIPITPIQIGQFLSGNVIAGQGNVGKALGLGMVVIIAVVMTLYAYLQRRAARWLR
jgi:putative spermidine/putrescine transport system permease protein